MLDKQNICIPCPSTEIKVRTKRRSKGGTTPIKVRNNRRERYKGVRGERKENEQEEKRVATHTGAGEENSRRKITGKKNLFFSLSG